MEVSDEVTVAGATFSGEIAARRCDDGIEKRSTTMTLLRAQQEPQPTEGLHLAVGSN